MPKLLIATNVNNLNRKNNSSPMIENIQYTHEALPSISLNISENEQKGNSQIENDRQPP